jgi:hypothetical protein
MKIVSLIIAVVAMATVSLYSVDLAQAQESNCPSGPGNCTCNPASGVMTDHGMQEPFNRINNGCTADS